MLGKYRLTTLGCKVNQYESQQIRELFDTLGMRPACVGEIPDVAVVNACAVTSTASSKSRRAIRRAALNGHTPVVVIGCGASADAERLRALPGVIAVLGHDADAHAELRELMAHRPRGAQTRPAGESSSAAEASTERPDANRNDVWMIPGAAKREPERAASRTANSPSYIIPSHAPVVKANRPMRGTVGRFAGRQRALIKVQDGCDAFCSYCIVPRLRSDLRSKPIPVAVAEAEGLVRSGHREIVVTGIFLGAFGRGTAVRKRFDPRIAPLAQLVEALAHVPGLSRLRVSSLEPGDLGESLLSVLASHENCVPHLHLPLQSGSGTVLKRMNRQYTPRAFVETVDRLRAVLDRPAITTDVIVGFPGETEEDFQATLEAVRHVGFLKIHAFPFSPREGTAAARWRRDFVQAGEVRERMRRLAEVERACSLAYRRSLLGCVERVLVEGPGPVDLEGEQPPSALRAPALRHGRADRYFVVHFEAENARPGDLVSVRLDRAEPTGMYGTCLSRGL